MKKILITDTVDKKCASILEAAGFDVSFKPGISKDEIISVIKDYNGLIVRSETKVTPDIISLMENMEVIGRAGTGVDNIDLETATRKGIIVMNTPGGNTISAAEHTMALMLAMCRNIPQANFSIRNKKWDRKSFKGSELQGKTLGLIGLGKIGREVAARSRAFQMNVISYDPVVAEDIVIKEGIEPVSLENLFKRSDIISLHVPLNNDTKNIISEKNLSLCKNGVKIINCARGGIINERDMLQALNSGKVSAAAFDVYSVEPPDLSDEIFNHPKIVCTPHLGASTDEAQEKVAVQIAEQIVDLFNNRPISGAVNAASISGIENKEIKPFVLLAEKIGLFHAQLMKGHLKQININYSGDMLQAFTSLLATALLKGFLSTKISEPVNLINTPFHVKKMGIVINETKTGSNPDYINLLSAEFETDFEKRSIAGTVFGHSEIRIVKIDSYSLDLKPEGYMLLYTNIDKPGMLATVGKILADENINIAGLSLGRLEIGKEALTVINLDNAINETILSRISSINGVKDVFSIKI